MIVNHLPKIDIMLTSFSDDGEKTVTPIVVNHGVINCSHCHYPHKSKGVTMIPLGHGKPNTVSGFKVRSN